MKKIFMMLVLVCGALCLNSCLEYDEPGDELELNQKLYQYEKVGPTNGGADNGGQNNQ